MAEHGQQRPLQQTPPPRFELTLTSVMRRAVSCVGLVYLLPHESSGSGPRGCFRMLSRSQGSEAEALNRSSVLHHPFSEGVEHLQGWFHHGRGV